MNNISEAKLSILKKINSTIQIDDPKINKLIFVYCPPKVGSTSLVSSLRLSGSHLYKVIHIHDETMLEVLTGFRGVTILEIIQYNIFLKKNVIVIDIYREPLEKKMSEFFGKLGSYHFNTHNRRVETYAMERITERFNEIFPHLATGDYYLEKYPEIVACPPSSFDFTNKFLMHKKNNLTFLKLRLRDASEWSSILKSALDLNVTIIKDYERESLPLGGLYRRFKKKYKIPENFVTLIQEDRFFKFYLTPEEQRIYLDRLVDMSISPCSHFTDDEYKIYTLISTKNQCEPDVESQHYFDEGCVCINCSRMRRVVLHDLKSGREPRCRIVHKDVIAKIKNDPQSLVVKPFHPVFDNVSKPLPQTTSLQVPNLTRNAIYSQEVEYRPASSSPETTPQKPMKAPTKKIAAPAKFNIHAPAGNNSIFGSDPNYLRNRPGISMSRFRR